MTHPSKAKGDAFERLIARYFADEGFIVERIPAGASDDRGDLWIPGVTIQCKNRTRTDLPGWWADTERQRDYNAHDDAVLIHKRVGTVDPARQWVTVDLAQAISLLRQAGR